ncbi:MAG: hypothetical protein M1821_006634 [Bathelium mastoideum]|nr:MAG: hypothetical protein M1821_006634 [Bathelium mastoideum]
MSLNLNGRKVLVTGGARGIGAKIVARFAAEGCDVAINYLNSQDIAESLAKRVQLEHGVKAVTIQGDMAHTADCKALVRKAVEALGGLDVLISNAGNTKIAAFDDLHALSEEDWDHTWNVLTKANVFLLQEALPTFNANPEGGVFLIMSSLAGLITNGSSMAYSVTRAATLHLMQCLAQTQGPKVRVNAVCPGFVSTERSETLGPERIKGFEEMATLKRLTTREEVADAFVFLAKNPAMTGERIRIDSGMAIR